MRTLVYKGCISRTPGDHQNDQAKFPTYTRRGEGRKAGKKARKKRKQRQFYLKVMCHKK